MLSSITERLVERHEGWDVLDAVSRAYGDALAADAVGVVLADPAGGLRLVIASDERSRLIEVMQTSSEEGPCVDSIHAVASVAVDDLSAETVRWPRLAAAAQRVGFRGLYAFPLRLDHLAVGGINVFYTDPAPLCEAELDLGQSLADLAVLGLVQEHDERRVERLAERALAALNDRALVTQAVGIVSGTLDIDADTARDALTAYSHRTDTSPLGTAQALTDGELAPAALVEDTPRG